MPYLEVIPLRKLPPRFISLDYEITKEMAKNISVGDLVAVPFRSLSIMAIALKLKNFSETKGVTFKQISQTPLVKNYLTKNQINLFLRLAKHYYVSPALFIKTLVPLPAKKREKEISDKLPKITDLGYKNIDIKKILEKNSRGFIYYQYRQDCLNAYFSIIKKMLDKQSGQILILVPTKKELNEIKIQLQAQFSENAISSLTSEKTSPQIYSEWQKIKTGRSKIIIGTKISLFAPFQKLAIVIIDNEQNENHRQSEINPRYDARIAAGFLANEANAKLLLSSFAPSVETYWQIKNKKINFYNLQNQSPVKKPIFIDLKDERQSGNYRLLAEKSLLLMKETLEKKRKCLLFLNRRGFASLTVCLDCGQTALCPNCRLPLNYHQEKNKLICHYCLHQEKNWLACPECSGTRLKAMSAGTEKLRQELESSFPGVKIILLDSDYQKKYNPSDIQDANIIIGTKYALENLSLINYHLFVSILTDLLFLQNDFNSTIASYQLLKSLCLYPDSQLIIQAKNLDNFVFQKFSELKNFYELELSLRKKYNYPPFYRMAKIIFKDFQEQTVIRQAAEFLQKIKKLNINPADLKYSEVIEPPQAKIRKNYRRFIILKYQNETTLEKIMGLGYNQKILLEKDPYSLIN